MRYENVGGGGYDSKTMISAGVQSKLDRVAEIRAQIDELERELEAIFGGEVVGVDPAVPGEDRTIQTEVLAAPAPKAAYSFVKHTTGKSCCGSLGKRHKKDCPGASPVVEQEDDHEEKAEELDPDAVDQEEEQAPAGRKSPAQRRPPLAKDQWQRVKDFWADGKLMAIDVENKTGYDAEEIGLVIASPSYMGYIFERKKPR